MHVVFNAQSVLAMYFYQRFFPRVWLEQTQAVTTSEDMIAAISVYLVIAVISTALAVCVLVWLCRNQGREEYVLWLLRERKSGKKKGKLISIPLIIAIVICLGYMILNVVWQ